MGTPWKKKSKRGRRRPPSREEGVHGTRAEKGDTTVGPALELGIERRRRDKRKGIETGDPEVRSGGN